MTEGQKKQTLGVAIASLVCGCLVLIPLLGILFSLAAIICGIVALVTLSKKNETHKGKGLAISGIVLGGIGILILPIVVLLAAIAIPNFLRARHNANEFGAIAAARTLSSACASYKAADKASCYPDSLDDLARAEPPFIDSELGDGAQNGYVFTYEGSCDSFRVTAAPESQGVSGSRTFSVDETGEVKSDGQSLSGSL